MANNNVHTGYWIDHSRGSVLGATITLETRYGNQLVSAATVVVNIIGVSLWSLLAFSLHQHFSQPGLRDEYEAQRQVLLRNTTGAETAAWSLLKNGLVWRGRRKGVLKQATFTALIPAAIYVLFIVAGVFVGRIATNSFDTAPVLLKSGSCGFIQSNGLRDSELGFQHVEINVSTVARQYSQSCYGGGGSASAISCSVYPTPNLNYTIELEQPCPFGENACFTDSSAKPMTLRTLPLDSHADLGINAPEGDRLTFEYQTTCAPLEYSTVERYSDIQRINVTDDFSINQTQLELGYYYHDLSPLFTYVDFIRTIGQGTIGYSVMTYQSLAPHTSNVSAWLPTGTFANTTGDLDFVIIAPNSITFTGPVKDVMFQTLEQPTNDTSFSYAPYFTKYPLYVMACSETYQICKPRSGCTGWHGAVGINDTIQNAMSDLDLNEEQNATYFRLAALSQQASLWSAINGVSNPLLASSYLSNPTGSQPLPDGFWRTEVEGWFTSVLSKIQYVQTIFVNVPLEIVSANGIEFLPAESQFPGLAKQCAQQRATSPAQYTNYNFFAIIFIATFGIVVPLLAMTIKFLPHHHLPWVQDKTNHRSLSYQAEGLMQLHRLAMEGAGYKGWRFVNRKDFPYTDEVEKRLPQAVLTQQGEEGEETLRYPYAHEGSLKPESDSMSNNSVDRRSGYKEVARNDPDR